MSIAALFATGIPVPGAYTKIPAAGFPVANQNGPFGLSNVDWPDTLPPRVSIPLPGFPRATSLVTEWVPGVSLPDGTMLRSTILDGPDMVMEAIRIATVLGLAAAVAGLPTATVIIGTHALP
jgi:hypothetical protein